MSTGSEEMRKRKGEERIMESERKEGNMLLSYNKPSTVTYQVSKDSLWEGVL